LTYGDEAARVDPRGSGAGVNWQRVGGGAATPALRPGTFSFSMLAPTGREHFGWPEVKMFTELVNPTPAYTCQGASAINDLRPTPLSTTAGTRTVASAVRVTWGAVPRVEAEVSSDTGIPTGTVEVTGAGISGASAELQGGPTSAHAVVTLPGNLPVGTHQLTVTYKGAGSFTGSTTTTQLVVSKVQPSVSLRLTKKPRPDARGSATVTVGSPVATAPRGRVVVTLKKGKVRRTARGVLDAKGRTKLRLPKLAAGRWRVTATYPGDEHYAAATISRRVRVRLRR
jgi:hypothetical protein